MISESPEEVGEKVAQLGEPIAEFTVNRGRLIRNLVLAPFLILFGVGLFALMFFVGLVQFVHLWKLLLLAPVSLVAGVTLVVRAYRNLGLRVVVFPEGVVRFQREEVQTFFWDEIAYLWEKRNAFNWAYAWHGALVFGVQRADGEEISFDDSLPGLTRLGQILQKQTQAHLLPRALATYDEGKTLQFGELKVSRKEWSHENDTLPWSEVKSIWLTDSGVSIYKKGKWSHWFHATVTEVPNFHVFRVLLAKRSPVKPSE
ncbi:MAG TPA: DUF6585 family protein [Gemmataceae bacterium]|nr:DUF6585 family protein [Gemmataceae bacterium]